MYYHYRFYFYVNANVLFTLTEKQMFKSTHQSMKQSQERKSNQQKKRKENPCKIIQGSFLNQQRQKLLMAFLKLLLWLIWMCFFPTVSAVPVLCFAQIIVLYCTILYKGSIIDVNIRVNTFLLYSRSNQNKCSGKSISNLLHFIGKYIIGRY